MECNKLFFPSDAKDWKKFETNNKTIAFNVFSLHNRQEKNKHIF